MRAILPFMISLIMIIGVFPISYFAYWESDFVLEAHLSREASEPPWKVTKFMISGESDKQICPSGQCSISTEGESPALYPPNTDSMYFSYDMHFILKDNMTHPEIGPKKKEFLEQFTTGLSHCRINDIIEKNGQELYFCHGENSISRIFDSKTWYYDAIGIFDAKNYVLKVYGNFTAAD